MEKDKNEIEIKIENIEKIKISKKEKDKNENPICYICQEIPIDSINPAGCNHVFCRAHLKVIYIMKYFVIF
jgi:hypothetical protein